MLTGILVVVSLATGLSVALLAAKAVLISSDTDLVDEIEARLPRIQCAQCGFPGCRPYAEAIAAGKTEINRCPPGGDATIESLAALLAQDTVALDRTLGSASLNQIAVIDEEVCIGCNLCARACPVDAIVGVHQMMHTILADRCTGCELCLPPCPVDCIHLERRSA